VDDIAGLQSEHWNHEMADPLEEIPDLLRRVHPYRPKISEIEPVVIWPANEQATGNPIQCSARALEQPIHRLSLRKIKEV